MLNHVVLVGRLVDTPEIKKLEKEKIVTNIILAVPRAYKNESGEYETDFFDCELWNGVANATIEYCKKGDIIGIKGSLKTDYYIKDDIKIKTTKIVAEKITFLSSKKESEE